MQKELRIRQILKEDINQIEGLWCELKQHHQDRTNHYLDYYKRNTFSTRKAELLNKDAVAIFVANHDKEAVGFCVASITANLGEIDSLYLKPAARGQGSSRQLMAAAMGWLGEQAPENIRLLVGDGNEEAITYYEKLGFKKRATMMQFFDEE